MGKNIVILNGSPRKTGNTAALVQECAMHGLIVESAGTYGNVIRFLAPLVITDEQLEAGLAIMEQAIVRCMSKEAK